MKWTCGWGVGLLLVVLVSGCGGNTENAQSYFDEGAERYQEGDYDGAIAAYKKGMAVEPNSAMGFNLTGMAYRKKFNTVRATEWKEKEIEAFENAVAADSTFWPAQINLGATLYYLGRKAEAAPYFKTALALHPDNPEREELEAFILEGEGEQ